MPSERGRRIVLTTLGSLGDLHPYIALARGLRDRGYDPVIATSEAFRRRVEPLGINFSPIRPDEPDWDTDPTLMARVMDMRKGGEVIIREYLMPILRETYEDILAASTGADLVVSHTITFPARVVAEVIGAKWASSMLQPFGFFSRYDPPVLPPAQFIAKLRFLGPGFHGCLFRAMRKSVQSWGAPWHQLRAELGLPAATDPLFEGQHAPDLVLALFSAALAQKQPDWPSQTVVTGFPFYDRDDSVGLGTALSEFLDAGPPPIVFTLGSAAVRDAGSFFRSSAEAAHKLGQRAVLLIGKDARNRIDKLPAGIVAFEYAPYSGLFPRAAAIVHQGGVGTTGQAMRAGRPMIVMPYAHDQPDNAARMQRLGISRTIHRKHYNATTAERGLRKLLSDPSYAEKAKAVSARVRSEDGVKAACDAIEELLAKGVTSRHAGYQTQA